MWGWFAGGGLLFALAAGGVLLLRRDAGKRARLDERLKTRVKADETRERMEAVPDRGRDDAIERLRDGGL